MSQRIVGVAILLGAYCPAIPRMAIAQPCAPHWASGFGPVTTPFTNVGLAFAPFDEDANGPQPESMFVGGSFPTIDGIVTNHIARFDGLHWNALHGTNSIGVEGAVSALSVYDVDGAGPQPAKLIVGGGFSSVDGILVNRIAAWDGTTWSALTGPSGTGVQGYCCI